MYCLWAHLGTSAPRDLSSARARHGTARRGGDNSLPFSPTWPIKRFLTSKEFVRRFSSSRIEPVNSPLPPPLRLTARRAAPPRSPDCRSAPADKSKANHRSARIDRYSTNRHFRRPGAPAPRRPRRPGRSRHRLGQGLPSRTTNSSATSYLHARKLFIDLKMSYSSKKLAVLLNFS